MDHAITTRLTHLLAMTTSPHDGEALNACRLAWKLMKEIGINYQDLVEGAAMPDTHKPAQKAYQRGHEEGYAKGLREGQNAPRPRPGSWQALVRELLDQPDQLSEWEQTFLASFQAKRWHSPTERQRNVLKRIATKLGLDLPDGNPGPPPEWVQPNSEQPW